MKYVCVGTGWISRLKHLTYYQKHPEIEVVAVVDTNIDAAKCVAKEFGIPKWYRSLQECLEETRPDIVSICTPNKYHYDMVSECLKRTINVHCEKPLALNRSECIALERLADESKAILFTGMNKRYSSFAQILKKQIDSPGFGRLYSLEMSWVRKRGIPGKGGWFTNKELSGGGVLIDLGVHLIDLALYLTGFPAVKSVLGQTGNYFMHDDIQLTTWAPVDKGVLCADVEDSCVLLFTLDGGVSVSIRLAWAENCIENERVEVACYGTNLGVFYQEDKGVISSSIEEGEPKITRLFEPVEGPLEFEQQCEREISACIECCKKGVSDSTAQQAAQVMGIIDSVYEMNGK